MTHGERRHGARLAFKADAWRQYGRFSWALVLQGFLLRRNYRPLVTLRLCQYANGKGGVLAAAGLLLIARVLHRMTCHWAGIDLPWRTRVAPGLVLAHGWGIVVNEEAVVGRNVTLLHGVTLGRRDRIAADGSRTIGGSPIIEDEVWIGPHATIIGPVTIGRGSRISGGAWVSESVPAYSIVIGNPSRVVKSGCVPDVVNGFGF